MLRAECPVWSRESRAWSVDCVEWIVWSLKCRFRLWSVDWGRGVSRPWHTLTGDPPLPAWPFTSVTQKKQRKMHLWCCDAPMMHLCAREHEANQVHKREKVHKRVLAQWNCEFIIEHAVVRNDFRAQEFGWSLSALRWRIPWNLHKDTTPASEEYSVSFCLIEYVRFSVRCKLFSFSSTETLVGHASLLSPGLSPKDREPPLVGVACLVKGQHVCRILNAQVSLSRMMKAYMKVCPKDPSRRSH